MSEMDDFLNADADVVDGWFGIVTMTCNGQSFDVVWAGSRKSYEGALGGLESDIQATATAQAADVTNPKSLLQKRCTISGETFRVAEVMDDGVSVVFTLADANNSK